MLCLGRGGRPGPRFGGVLLELRPQHCQMGVLGFPLLNVSLLLKGLPGQVGLPGEIGALGPKVRGLQGAQGRSPP